MHHIATLYFSAVSEWLKVPDTQFMLDHVRPDFLMLRVSALIGYQSNVQCENLGDNCIQNFHLERYVIRYTVRNFVDTSHVKHNFRKYIPPYTFPNENFEYGYSHSNVLFNFCTTKSQYLLPKKVAV